MPPFNVNSRRSINFCQLYTHNCGSSKSLEGDRGKDRVPLCRLSTSFQDGPHQKLFFHLKEIQESEDERRAKLDDKI